MGLGEGGLCVCVVADLVFSGKASMHKVARPGEECGNILEASHLEA